MMSALRELYQEVILDHNKSPRNFRKMEDATRAVDGYNPLCGDHYKIFVKVEGDVIQDISFDGAGCAISKASASVMSSVLKGKTKEEAERLFQQFHKLVTGDIDAEKNLEALGKLAAFAGVSEFPVRVKCASLAWHTMHAALEARVETISTE
ncbi:MAG TPA: SUF system NifU family Fe-S cluster assembly protein [Bacteroidota bacterium]|nr:SUF system NifU family Fe-S cluster assembly protein [Bacteroidota bacterium]